jgi:hypothetical protein
LIASNATTALFICTFRRNGGLRKGAHVEAVLPEELRKGVADSSDIRRSTDFATRLTQYT